MQQSGFTKMSKMCVRRLKVSSLPNVNTPGLTDSIKVYARLKPFEEAEQAAIENSSLKNVYEYDANTISYSEKDRRGCELLSYFSFHEVFAPTINQLKLFEATADGYIDSLISGENRLFFTYGTTNSGKTYTMLGNNKDPGILPRCSAKLFIRLEKLLTTRYVCPDQGSDLRVFGPDKIELNEMHKELIDGSFQDGNLTEENFSCDVSLISRMFEEMCNEMPTTGYDCVDQDASYTIWVSYLEVYNESIYDLLDPSPDIQPLKIGYDSLKNTYVKGLRHILVVSWLEMWKVFLYGRRRVHMHRTELNASSSRSHSVFCLKLVKLKDDNYTVSSFSVCDLAGNERQKKAANTGEQLVESRYINSSLMVLNRCFTVVRENNLNNTNKKPPYRESKLTLIIQKAISYGEPITMVVNINQNPLLFEESKTVLRMSSVAQEMVKKMPNPCKKFLKPKSRFSIACAAPNAPISSIEDCGISGLMHLEDSTPSFSSSKEKEQEYELKIKQLEGELKKTKEENKSLLEIVEDARNEYLYLGNQCEERLNKLLDEQLQNEALKINLANKQAENENNAYMLEQANNNYTRLEEENTKLSEEIKALRNEKSALMSEIKELKKDQKEAKSKKGRPLLNTLDYMNEPAVSLSPPMASSSHVETSSVTSKRTPRFTRKCKKKEEQ